MSATGPDVDRGSRDPTARILIGFIAVWLVLDRSAWALGSFSGEAGLLVFALVLLAALAVKMSLFGRSARGALRELGFGRPTRASIFFAGVLAIGLMAFYPLFALLTSSPMRATEGWLLLAPGLFAQGGLAEEALFRGYLFRHLRQGRGFWRAAWLASLPFIAVHLLLFLSLDFPVALAALGVSVSLSFPFARLFERAGNSIWPPALLHFVIQGSIKLVEVPEESFMTMALVWMVVSAAAPWLVFLLKPSQNAAAGGRIADRTKNAEERRRLEEISARLSRP